MECLGPEAVTVWTNDPHPESLGSTRCFFSQPFSQLLEHVPKTSPLQGRKTTKNNSTAPQICFAPLRPNKPSASPPGAAPLPPDPPLSGGKLLHLGSLPAFACYGAYELAQAVDEDAKSVVSTKSKPAVSLAVWPFSLVAESTAEVYLWLGELGVGGLRVGRGATGWDTSECRTHLRQTWMAKPLAWGLSVINDLHD